VRLLYIKEAVGDGDLPIVRQLIPLTSDRKVTSVRSCRAALTALRKTTHERRFDILVTSPTIAADELGSLVRDILKEGPPVTLVPVVENATQSLKAFQAGADAVLMLASDGELVNAGEVFSGLARRFTSTTKASPAPPTATPAPNGHARVLTGLLLHAESKSAEPIKAEVVRRVDADIIDAVKRLVPQIAPAARTPGPWELDQIIKDPGTAIIVARAGDEIVGMLSLHTFRATTGIHAWIQDLVVDKQARGRQVSEILTREAVEVAIQRGAHTAELRSQPSRSGASKLYERLGFERREAHVYRYRFST
jgi:ribosomal protein S18 acetylase RimI-like enzyme